MSTRYIAQLCSGPTLLLILASGCATSVCRLDLPEQNRIELAQGDITRVDASVWAQLLLRGSSYTCTGARLFASQKATTQLGTYRAIVEPDAAGEGRHLVWLIVARDQTGWRGPLALVERRGDALVARSVGLLALPGGQVALRYNYGEHRETVWAISKVCHDARALARFVCHEQVAIFQRSEGQLVALSAPITTHREQIKALGGGWHHVSAERCQITEQSDRLMLAQIRHEHEIQAHRRNAQPRRRRSETRNLEIVLSP